MPLARHHAERVGDIGRVLGLEGVLKDDFDAVVGKKVLGRTFNVNPLSASVRSRGSGGGQAGAAALPVRP